MVALALLAGVVAFDVAANDLAVTARTLSTLRELTTDPRLPAVVRVRLLSDTGATGHSRLLEALYQVAATFTPLGIRLEVVQAAAIMLPDRVTPASVARLVARHRPGADILIVHTARELKTLAPRGGGWLDVAGWADPTRGVVMIDARRTITAARLASTLQHEIAHLFYVPHDPPASATVMTPHENDSVAWSPSAARQLSALRFRPWW